MSSEGTRLKFGCSRAAWEQLYEFFGARAVRGIEEASGDTYMRSLAIDGSTGIVELSQSDGSLEVRILSGELELAAVADRCRSAFDLDADAGNMTTALGADPALRPFVAAHPEMRVPGAFEGSEIAVRAILGQQISVKGAATLAGRLVAAEGSLLDTAAGSITSLFPDPRTIANSALDSVGMPETRRRSLRALAAALASGDIVLEPGRDPAGTAERLVALPGIGKWTASYVCMRALGDRDAFLPSDLGVRKGAAALGLPASVRALTDYAERWRPWRAYAVMYLWLASRGAPGPRLPPPGSAARRSKR